MKRKWLLLSSCLLLSAAFATCNAVVQDENLNDPYLWLEEIEGTKAINWVKKQNEATLAVFQKDPRLEKFKKESQDILEAKDKIPYGALMGNYVYNFWQDDTHVRGLWRRTTLDEYKKENPQWEILLDIDALAKSEKENWVYEGNQCLPPSYNRCLISLSRGGKDAVVIREFYTQTKAFIPNGYHLKEAKSETAWLDENTLILGTDFGPNSLTQSGYPRILKIWARGRPLETAPVLFEGKSQDIGVWASSYFRPEGKTVILTRAITFYESEYWLLINEKAERIKIPLPANADLQGVFRGEILALLRSDWETSSGKFRQGSLISLAIEPLLKNAKLQIKQIYKPDERSSIRQTAISDSFVLVSLLENVKGKILQFSLEKNGQWQSQAMPFAKNSTLSIQSSNAYSDIVFISEESFLVPTKLYLSSLKPQKIERVKTLPERFNAKTMEVNQKEATSVDGTLIPYFLIHPADLKLDSKNPTLLYGYGGFEQSITPFYLSVIGRLWLENSGIYVLANIRGGGEFGPRWHQAALKENRPKAFEDFIAVAEDIIRQKITSPKHLGIIGRSNGGLLVGAVFVKRPELFNAVVCEVPLLDMLRFHKLLAGASWVGEYGSPEDGGMRAILQSYSPYRQLTAGKNYPQVLFYTSTKDDRVHPGHARKMAAKMSGMGYKVFYYENIEGGHSAVANLRQKAERSALEYVYLLNQLEEKVHGELKHNGFSLLKK